MKTCILCHKPTTGSVGRAGLKWSFLCQPCKDAEDAALERQLTSVASATDSFLNKLIPNTK